MRCVALLVSLLICSFGWAADHYTVKQEPKGPPSDLSESIRELLDLTSETVEDPKGKAIARVWFRKEIPSIATKEQIKNGITHRELLETSIIGAVQFPTTFIDYRKQEIAAGVYTLRLAFQPDNGDHKDSAPHTEFLLLCPAQKDRKSDEMEPKSLYKMSFESTGGEHPGVMLLYPYTFTDKKPKIQDRGSGVWTLNSHRPVVSDAGQIEHGFSITIGGHSKLR